MGAWVDGRKSHFKDCLQQSKKLKSKQQNKSVFGIGGLPLKGQVLGALVPATGDKIAHTISDKGNKNKKFPQAIQRGA